MNTNKHKNTPKFSRNLTLRISEEHYQFLRQRAHLKHVTIQDVIRKAISQGILDSVNSLETTNEA
jgi:uncharacterized protein (DUF1778 family)